MKTTRCLTLLFLLVCAPVQAQDKQVTGERSVEFSDVVVCDTQAQVERYVAFYHGDKEAAGATGPKYRTQSSRGLRPMPARGISIPAAGTLKEMLGLDMCGTQGGVPFVARPVPALSFAARPLYGGFKRDIQ